MDYQACKKICEEYYGKDAEYIAKYNNMKQLASEHTVRLEYGLGGAVIHRGFYCPSLVQDIVIGNCRRGKRIIKPKKCSFYDYVYHFDKNDNLILIDRYAREKRDWLCSQEYIFYSDNETFSINFNLTYDKVVNLVSFLAKCKYDEGKLITYDRYMYLYRTKCHQIERESYEYHEDGTIKDMIMELYMAPDVYRKDVFSFNHDENGYLKDYTVHHKQYGFDGKVSENESRYPVLIRRKV